MKNRTDKNFRENNAPGSFGAVPDNMRRIRRQRQLRGRLLLSAMTFCLILGITFSGRVLISDAKSGAEELSYKYYTSIMINCGDTLWSIALSYKDEHYASIQEYVDEVVQINHLSGEDQIHAGRSLIIPYYSDEFVK